MPTGDIHGLKPNARVVPRTGAETVAVGPQLLGRIIDGAGTPLDGLGPIACEDRIRLTGAPINPLSRQPIEQPLDVGVRAINSLLTVGRGQRIGLFAGSGVGKSVLLGMMARYTSADVIVVGLIGERGREVKEFVERILGTAGSEARDRCRDAGRQSAADALARRVACDGHRGVLPRSGQERPADHGLADALRAGAARDRSCDRRSAGDQGLSAVGVRDVCRSSSSVPAMARRAVARSRRSTRC